MKPFAVVTDSGADLPAALAERYDIHILPLWLRMGGKMLRDGIDIAATTFYQRLAEGRAKPSTSQPSVGEFLELYRQLAMQARAILSIHLPGRLSGTLSSAQAAARELRDFPIRIIDSGTAAMGQGFLALTAGRLASQGASLAEALSTMQDLIPRVQVLAMLDTLAYALAGGRISLPPSIRNPLLNVRVILSLNQGRIRILKILRSRAAAMAYLLDAMEKRIGDLPAHFAVFHANSAKRARELQQNIAARFACIELVPSSLTPVLGAHAGPGALGAAFYTDAEATLSAAD